MSEKLDLIRKYAQEAEAPVPVPSKKKNKPAEPATAAAAAPVVPNSDVPVPLAKKFSPELKNRLQGKPKVQPGNSPQQIAAAREAVKEMQIAMQELAGAVITDSESGTMAYKPHDAQQPGAAPTVKSSKKSFNDFITEQYLGGLDEDKKGVEWNTDQKVTSLQGKKQTQTDLYELDVVMNTLRRIGASSKEFIADGKWDFRTDNALRNIMGFSYALLQLEGDFGLENNFYSFDHWKNFNKALTGYKISNGIVQLNAAQKVARANAINKHLKAITKLYSHFRQQVLARPEFRPTIEGKRLIDRYSAQGSNKDVLTSQEDQMSKSDAIKIPVTYPAPKLPGGNLDYIPLKALRDKGEYIKWMVGYAGNSEQAATDIFNKTIKPKIETT
jgi:hypothetical protein